MAKENWLGVPIHRVAGDTKPVALYFRELRPGDVTLEDLRKLEGRVMAWNNHELAELIVKELEKDLSPAACTWGQVAPMAHAVLFSDYRKSMVETIVRVFNKHRGPEVRDGWSD